MSSKKRALQVHHTTLIVSNIKRLYGLSVSRPALLHYLTNSAVVLPLSLTEHASGFRVCWGIWVWITEQRLGKTQNNLLLVYTTSLEKLSKNISLSGSNINDDQQTITSDKILTRVVMPILVANYNWKKNQKKKHMQITLFIFCPAEAGSQIAINIFFPWTGAHQFQISNLLIADIRCISLHLTIPLSNISREKNEIKRLIIYA
jgi:hypothetical protein